MLKNDSNDRKDLYTGSKNIDESNRTKSDNDTEEASSILGSSLY